MRSHRSRPDKYHLSVRSKAWAAIVCTRRRPPRARAVSCGRAPLVAGVSLAARRRCRRRVRRLKRWSVPASMRWKRQPRLRVALACGGGRACLVPREVCEGMNRRRLDQAYRSSYRSSPGPTTHPTPHQQTHHALPRPAPAILPTTPTRAPCRQTRAHKHRAWRRP